MKKILRLLLTLSLIIFCNIHSFSDPVSLEKAKLIAQNFYSAQYFRVYGIYPQYKAITINPISYKNVTSYWVCTFSKVGFVIVSGDDNAFPIIGYSFDSKFDLDNIPESAQYWLKNISESIKNSTNASCYKNLWAKYSDKQEMLKTQKKYLQSVAPFVTTRWDQGINYNNDCPVNSQGPGGHCVTGCVATAMAQAMKYYNYPERGNDSILYTGDVNIKFEDTYYRWDSMTTYANSTSADAISELMFHCGVTIFMNYGPNESGTMTELVPYALMHYFRYHPAVAYLDRKHYTDKEWDVLIRDNLDMHHPIVYSGSGMDGGHAWICDGYQDTCFYHFNWGWSGSSNGYFYYNDLTPGGYSFNNDQGAVANIMPYNSPYCAGGRVMTDYSRSFGDGSSYSYYWNNTNCDWLIAPDSIEKITLTFTTFNTQANADFVSVFDGADASAPLIGKYSGNQLPPVIISSGDKLFLTFTSNESNQGQGFDANYETKIIGVNSVTLNRNIEIYPNPVKDKLFISLNDIENWNGNIEIYNITGKLVYSNKLNINSEKTSSINISNLPDGFYTIKAFGNNGLFNSKFVKE
ncbi:MAG: hypothetical protein A2X08_15750 [Bacteroidetes bacterium GWA2_32_17]|nr:MAG: hypothetical protein A2X08_15750 [Bacteroidetes bacterium GWA2_32_17]